MHAGLFFRLPPGSAVSTSAPGAASAHGKASELAAKWRVKGQDDIRFGYTTLDQPIGNPVFGAVMLDPDFVAPNVDMKHTTMDALIRIPAHAEQLVMIMFRVDHLLDLDLAIRRSILAILT